MWFYDGKLYDVVVGRRVIVLCAASKAEKGPPDERNVQSSRHKRLLHEFFARGRWTVGYFTLSERTPPSNNGNIKTVRIGGKRFRRLTNRTEWI